MLDILAKRPKNIRIVFGYKMLFIKIIQEAAYRFYILLLPILAAFYELSNTVFDYPGYRVDSVLKQILNEVADYSFVALYCLLLAYPMSFQGFKIIFSSRSNVTIRPTPSCDD